MLPADPTNLTTVRLSEHHLDPDEAVQTAVSLAKRVRARLPDSSLARLADELAHVSRETAERASAARKPIYSLRILSGFLIALVHLSILFVAHRVHARWEFSNVAEFFEAIDAGFNIAVILAGAVYSLVTLERRIKRKKILGRIYELREMTHRIDLHQLAQTPELIRPDEASSGNQLSEDSFYLLVCNEMLALIGNLAPIYTQGLPDDTVLRRWRPRNVRQ